MTPSEVYYQTAHWRALRAACFARDGGWCIVEGCQRHARVADHIKPRPQVSTPTAEDCLENLRSLCLSHDAQVKELRRGQSLRANAGQFKVIGCDADGWPRDPKRR